MRRRPFPDLRQSRRIVRPLLASYFHHHPQLWHLVPGPPQSTIGHWFLPPRICATQGVDVPQRISNGIQHDEDRITADVYLHQCPPTSLWVVIPSVRQSRDAHNRVVHLVSVQMVHRRQLGTHGIADDKPGNPQGLGHTETLDALALGHGALLAVIEPNHDARSHPHGRRSHTAPHRMPPGPKQLLSHPEAPMMPHWALTRPSRVPHQPVTRSRLS